jgi:hypothetical protein
LQLLVVASLYRSIDVCEAHFADGSPSYGDFEMEVTEGLTYDDPQEELKQDWGE